MPLLSRLQLTDFRNYSQADVTFADGVNCFTGNNGSGKTSMLDAIHYLAMTRGYFNASDLTSIRQGAAAAIIRGEFLHEDAPFSVACNIRTGQKKIFRFNQKDYDRLSDHIGKIPVVMIAPTDQELITEGSEPRRRFLDSILSQYNHSYLEELIRYNQLLTQRNSLLRSDQVPDWSSLAVWDEQLAASGDRIHQTRLQFMESFTPVFSRIHQEVSGEGADTELVYESQVAGSHMSELLQRSRRRDEALQYTSAGIHRDDLLLRMKGMPLKRIASQGQQKSVVIALKVAQYEFIRDHGPVTPLLLLDDVFDKLDDLRVSKFMELVSHESFGQIFITDTHTGRVQSIFGKIGIPVRVFQVNEGTVQEALHAKMA